MTTTELKKYIDKNYTGKEVKLLDFDNDITSMINTNSIFEYDAEEMLENSFGYMITNCDGVNVHFADIKGDFNDIDTIYVTISKTEII